MDLTVIKDRGPLPGHPGGVGDLIPDFGSLNNTNLAVTCRYVPDHSDASENSTTYLKKFHRMNCECSHLANRMLDTCNLAFFPHELHRLMYKSVQIQQ
ncbi:hypothetical protein PCANC_16839 [Puccinia coronata f. sp. avenae]|uniref:Uncharacterized protein n=1 Tax=Puccinia coronata f. sp. avenae TaxID=200324 RepID=A0A2N5SSQ4_9BASI|nr:hypothetical protein PCANC_16839 [Puccinia coronata f. sp. avenae]